MYVYAGLRMRVFMLLTSDEGKAVLCHMNLVDYVHLDVSNNTLTEQVEEGLQAQLPQQCRQSHRR